MKPSREHMIETVESFLKHVGWQDHQALIVCHDDKNIPIVHVMVNVVHRDGGESSLNPLGCTAYCRDDATYEWDSDDER